MDGSLFTYDDNKKELYFSDRLWLTELPNYSMEFKGTVSVVELTSSLLVLRQTGLLGGVETYTFSKYRNL